MRIYQDMIGGVMETLADITNGADATYYYYVDMTGFRRIGSQLVLSGGSGTVTVTVEGTMEDVEATSVGAWVDVTNTLFGAASYTASNVLMSADFKAGLFRWLRFKVVAASTSNNADWKIFTKRST